MSVVSGGTEAGGLGGSSAVPVEVGSDVPVPAAGLQLLGQAAGSGYRVAPALVRRVDGQMLQLTALLYRLLEAVDGRRGYDEIAAQVSTASGRSITGANARMLVEQKLRPLGLVCRPDGSQPELRKANPLLALRLRWVVSDPAATRRITAPFSWLFNPLAVAAVLLAFVAVCKWVLFDRGLALAAHQAFDRPGLLLAVFAITVVSAGFHEFGHAAAARYGGATPGAMGAGLYLVWPAFYTDVTDSYRLGRGGRIRTDLGGLYFNALLSVAMFGIWALTGWDAVLLVIGTQLVQMVRQLPPLVRFDGYHLLADVTGVPDLFHRIGPTLRGLLPGHRAGSQSQALKPWVRAVVTLWVLLVVPLLALTVLVTVLSLPRILATAAASFGREFSAMVERFGAFDVVGGLVKLLAVIAVGLPILGIGYLLQRTVRQLAGTVWRATAGRPGRRALAGLVAAAVLVGLLVAWWPRGNYRPIQPYERGTLGEVVPAAWAGRAVPSGLAEGRQSSAVTAWPASAGALPTADKPVLSLVLVPRTPAPDGKPAPTWVFPFNRPAAPGAGDNQSLAVNTADGSVVYDVAFALVWADGDTVLNKNEAYAFASCTACRATAISFQVVLIVGNAHVVVPQNISAAVNYDCLACVTQALAVQLVLSLPGTPSTAEAAEVEALWQQIQAFAGQLRGLSFAEIHSRLSSYERQLADVVAKYATGSTGNGAVPSATASSGGAPASSPVPTAGDSGAAGTDAAGRSAAGTVSPSSTDSPIDGGSASASDSASDPPTASASEASSSAVAPESGTPTSTP
ncbi:MAG: putative peptide zinc metalloprotease protein [Pseudonocardiales bacterium]|jgi:putative peptide zinc metalloprotease protein|nr:putative peptide zinc metalloprotease protein [Pseudonocardiales bacterium]